MERRKIFYSRRKPDLELGLYLLIQEDAAEGYEKANPFLISVPRVDGDSYIYDVDASPKLELEPTPTQPSTEPSTPPDIPQTGLTTSPFLSWERAAWRLLRRDGICASVKRRMHDIILPPTGSGKA